MRIEAAYAPSGETVLTFVEDVLAGELRRYTPLRVAGHLPGMTGDRLAVAVALLLGSQIGDRLDVGRPVSRRVAAAIGLYLGRRSLWVGKDEPVSYVHSAGMDLRIADQADVARVMGGIPERRSMTVVELPSHEAMGSLLTGGNWLLSTNSWVHAMAEPAARLAVPVLLAHHASASRVVIPHQVGAALTPEQRQALSQLLLATDLSPSWQDGGGDR